MILSDAIWVMGMITMKVMIQRELSQGKVVR